MLAAPMSGDDLTPARAGHSRRPPYADLIPDTVEYLATQNAHDPETLTRHMNQMARDGWALLTVDFAIRGESGTHTFCWRRLARAYQQAGERG